MPPDDRPALAGRADGPAVPDGDSVRDEDELDPQTDEGGTDAGEDREADTDREGAAALPLAGPTALQGLRQGGVAAGTSVLINGTSGGVGTIAVQMADALGDDVTGVCSTRNVELVESLGADPIVDYTRADFAESGRQYDCVIDWAGNRSM